MSDHADDHYLNGAVESHGQVKHPRQVHGGTDVQQSYYSEEGFTRVDANQYSQPQTDQTSGSPIIAHGSGQIRESRRPAQDASLRFEDLEFLSGNPTTEHLQETGGIQQSDGGRRFGHQSPSAVVDAQSPEVNTSTEPTQAAKVAQPVEGADGPDHEDAGGIKESERINMELSIEQAPHDQTM